MHLLIVEDEVAIRDLVTLKLEKEGIRVTGTSTVAAGIHAIESTVFDVAVLDLTLPDGSGLEVLTALRGLGSATHVIVLSGSGSESARVRALELGADDYVVKPFFVRELAARVLAVGRRQRDADERVLQHGALRVNLAAREVSVGSEPIDLTAKEFDLLAFLASRPGEVFSRDALLRSVWGSAPDWQTGATVTEHVRRLRAKLGPSTDGSSLRTVRGAGYRFDAWSEPLAPSVSDEKAADVPVAKGHVVLVGRKIAAADRPALALLGFADEADLVGTDVDDLVASESITAVRGRRRAIEAGDSPKSQLVRLLGAKGTALLVELSSEAIEWHGAPARRSTFHPISDPSIRVRHLATGVLGDVSDAVIVTDLDFHIRSWNEAAERLYGWAEDEVLGKHVADVIPWAGEHDSLNTAMEALEESGRWCGEGQQVGRDGSIIQVIASTSMVRDEGGDAIGVVSVNRAADALVGARSAGRSTEAEIAEALDLGQFRVHYQPVVALDDLRVTGLEALVRWNHPARGLLEPGAFIGQIEGTDTAARLGRATFGAACRQAAAWRRAGIDLEIAVNLSGTDMADPGLFDAVSATLGAAHLDAGAVWLEVTETSVVEDLDVAATVLNRLAELGLRIAIDDFGTGWASLTYLRQFPIHALKIDRSFVTHVDHDTQDVAIVRSIVSLGHELELLVVAEGVETLAQQAALRDLGCASAQGYLYGRPTPAAEVPLGRARPR
ncbi:MAG: diguanylate cyclase [Actinomycetota bacterium]|jgi:PAS domain S-box-containing protein